MISISRRPRRNRKSQVIRDMVRETTLSVNDFIFPLFLLEGKNKRTAIKSLPGIERLSLDLMLKEIDECQKLGVRAFDIFPVLDDSKKDKRATEGTRKNGFYCESIAKIKREFPDICIMTDVAMDPYSSDGHDGLYENGEILNDPTLEILAQMAVVQAQAGADILGPSDMMDGRVKAIRKALDAEGYTQVSIMSYSAKYASGFYGPFREALDSAPRAGDKKTYQMDPANRREALLEAHLDYLEGADMIMVKPALAYLDVISDLRRKIPLPIAAYNVSGEYAMIKAAAQNGWIDGKRAMIESLVSIKRAGAKIILSYFAKEVARILKDEGSLS